MQFRKPGEGTGGGAERPRKSTFLTSIFGGDDSQKAAALTLRILEDKAQRRLAEIGADAVPSLATLLRDRGLQEKIGRESPNGWKDVEAAAAKTLVKIGVPAVVPLAGLVYSGGRVETAASKCLKMVCRGDAARKDSDVSEGLLGMMESSDWNVLRAGIWASAHAGGDGVVGRLTELAREGWSRGIKERCELRQSQFRSLTERRAVEALEANGAQFRRPTVEMLIPAEVMMKIDLSEKPIEEANGYADRFEIMDRAERNLVRDLSVWALGEIGSPSAFREVLGMLGSENEMLSIRASMAAKRAISKGNPEVLGMAREAVRRGKEIRASQSQMFLGKALEMERAAEILEGIVG